MGMATGFLIVIILTASILLLADIREVRGGRQTEALDDLGKVVLTWEVFPNNQTIVFEIEVETSGYVGFGISPHGGMTGADIFVGGVGQDGKPYFSDRFGIGNQEPVVDDHSDWILLNAKETEENGMTKTYLKVSRSLDTCDDMDYPITNGTNRVIWALGETDDFKYHLRNKGTRSLSLLGSPAPKIDLDNHRMKRWKFTVEPTMPAVSTSYWCSFHKGPPLTKKNHIVAFEALLNSTEALRHTHHFALHNCVLPPDSNQTADEVFGSVSVDNGVQGGYCSEAKFPTGHCKEFLYVWAKGGKRMVFPENVGYAIGVGSDAETQRYYLLNIHFDNPEERKDVSFQTGLQIYYTEDIRPIDAGLIIVGYDVDVTLLVPPNVEEYLVAGHCSSDCTEKFPAGGITIFNSLLHSHLSGRKLKLRHIRGDQELPWIDYDDHYDFDYQQNRPLENPRQVFPQDHLIYECIYDSTWKNGEVVIGGPSSRDEMCQSFLWYYPKQDIDICCSDYPKDVHFEELGITKYHTELRDGDTNVHVIDEPENLRGLYEDAMNFKFPWTSQVKKDHQQRRIFGVQEAFCKRRAGGTRWQFPVSYPTNLKEFRPERRCLKSGGDSKIKTISAFILSFVFLIIPYHLNISL